MGMYVIEKKEKGDLVHLWGKISQLQEGTMKNGTKYLRGTITAYIQGSNATVFVSFCNNEMTKLFDRAKKALKEGSYVHVLAFPLNPTNNAKDGTPQYFARALNFHFDGCFRLQDGDRKTTLLFGVVRRVSETKSGKYVVSIPVSFRNEDGSKGTNWFQVFFSGPKLNVKLFQNGKMKAGDHICIFGSEVHTSEYNGNTNYNLSAFRYEVGFDSSTT